MKVSGEFASADVGAGDRFLETREADSGGKVLTRANIQLG